MLILQFKINYTPWPCIQERAIIQKSCWINILKELILIYIKCTVKYLQIIVNRYLLPKIITCKYMREKYSFIPSILTHAHKCIKELLNVYIGGSISPSCTNSLDYHITLLCCKMKNLSVLRYSSYRP